jgi:hypothetical protein
MLENTLQLVDSPLLHAQVNWITGNYIILIWIVLNFCEYNGEHLVYLQCKVNKNKLLQCKQSHLCYSYFWGVQIYCKYHKISFHNYIICNTVYIFDISVLVYLKINQNINIAELNCCQIKKMYVQSTHA